MNQQVGFFPVTISIANTQTENESFKRVLLSVIVVLSYIEAYNEDPKRTTTQLRLSVDAYNKRIREPNPQKKPRYKGSGNEVNDLNVETLGNKQELISCYNKIVAPVPPILYQKVAELLGEYIPPNKPNPDNKKAEYVKYINNFVSCQHLIYEAFANFDPFGCIFIGTGSKPHLSIDTFFSSGEELRGCILGFINATPKPIEQIWPPKRDAKLDETQPTQPAQGESFEPVIEPATVQLEATPSVKEKTEFYLAHYLNTEYKALLANVTLTWKYDYLDHVRLQQHEDLFGKPGIGFVSTQTGIQQAKSDNPYFLLLINDPVASPDHVSNKKSYYQQITIEKYETDGIRWGTYSTIVYRPVDGKQSYLPVSGLMVFQRVETLPDLNRLNFELVKHIFSFGNSDKTTSNYTIDYLSRIHSIRYQLQNQVISQTYPLASTRLTNWHRLQHLIGQYQCYYIRLLKNRFETSHVEIMADGTATLRQRLGDDNNPIRGFVTIDNEQVWLHFSHNEQTGREKIRFALKLAQERNEIMLLQGVFSSETFITSQLVSGRMLMVKRTDTSLIWPKFVHKDPEELVLADFAVTKGKSSDWILHFFTDTTELGLLSDGPIWADVARRLLEHPALTFLDKLCTQHKPYDRNEFYYYVFKKETPREVDFVIERSLITFHANGKVTLHSAGGNYTGYVYHRHDTLRLSLYNINDGFLEIFLELNHNTTHLKEVDVLYGLSAWHSPKRLQGKMVVLSRYGYQPGEFLPELVEFKFTPGDEKKRLETEDKRTGGILSYMRGNLHRYLHTTLESSAKLVRPRDQLYREMNFLIACYYGTLLQNQQTDHSARSAEQIFEACTHHLDESYTHGYACNFAGIVLPLPNELNLTKDAINLKEVKQLYANHMFPADISPANRERLLRDKPVKEILDRISLIAGEQRYLVWAFGHNGPLNRNELRDHARPFWPELIDLATAQTLPIPFGNPERGLGE